MAKMTFVEYVGAYKDYKKKNGKSAKLSEAEFKGLRKEFTSLLRESKKVSNYNKKKFSEEKDEVKVNSLKEAIEGMSAWKKENYGTSKLSESEIAAVKKAYFAEKREESKKMPRFKENDGMKRVALKMDPSYEEYYDLHGEHQKVEDAVTEATGLSDWAILRWTEHSLALVYCGDHSDLTPEIISIAKKVFKKSWLTESKVKKPSKYVEALRAYRKYKIEEMKDNSPLTESEKAAIKAELRKDAVMEKITEAKKLIRVATMKLEEGDMMGAAGAVQGAGDAINGATPVADPNAAAPATPLPQNVVDEIQNIKTSVDALAQEAGIESPVNLGADAAAGVPGAMDTTVPADPNAAGGMMESKELSATEKRIAERAKRISEGAVGANKGTRVPEPPIPQNSTGGNLESNKEEVQPGTVQQLLNGYASGPAAAEIKPAKRWPTKPINSPSDKKLGNIEEACEEQDENKEELNESNSWADRHIEEYNKPKFDWNEFLASRK